MAFKVPERYRVKQGAMASDAGRLRTVPLERRVSGHFYGR